MSPQAAARKIWPKIKDKLRVTADEAADLSGIGVVRARQGLESLWERGFVKKKRGYYIPMGDKYHRQSSFMKFIRDNPEVPNKQLKKIFKMDVDLASKDPEEHMRISREHRDTISYLENRAQLGKPLDVSGRNYHGVQELYYDLTEATRLMKKNPTLKLGTAITSERLKKASKYAAEDYKISKELNPVPKAPDLIKKARKLWDQYYEHPIKKNLKKFGEHLDIMRHSNAKSVKKELAKAKRAFNLEWKSCGYK